MGYQLRYIKTKIATFKLVVVDKKEKENIYNHKVKLSARLPQPQFLIIVIVIY